MMSGAKDRALPDCNVPTIINPSDGNRDELKRPVAGSGSKILRNSFGIVKWHFPTISPFFNHVDTFYKD